MSESQHSLADLGEVGLDALDRMLKVRQRARTAMERDAHQAARGERLAALVAGKPIADVWAKDLLPMLEKLWDAAEDSIRPGAQDAAALQGYKQGLKDFVELISGSIQMGHGAIRRIATRKLERVRYTGS